LSPGGPFDLFTTHIAHGLTPLSDTTKLFQVQQALNIINEWATPDRFPDFLVGDFNSTYQTDRYQAVGTAGYVDTYRAAGGVECTAPGGPGCSGNPPEGQESYTKTNTRAMSERIDYVFARPPAGCSFRSLRSNVIGNQPAKLADGRWVWPSDHLGMASVVRCR
jgi:endonuclease/exonuclease/phosphatase family metal-dependent hydrolase